MDTWKTYRKTALTRAKPVETAGICQTLEGPTAYQADDYLCIGVKNEQWPQSRARIEGSYDLIGGPDAQGYFSYRKKGTVQAQAQDRAFEVAKADGQILAGKAGDYMVTDLTGDWVVDREIFEQTYELVA